MGSVVEVVKYLPPEEDWDRGAEGAGGGVAMQVQAAYPLSDDVMSLTVSYMERGSFWKA